MAGDRDDPDSNEPSCDTVWVELTHAVGRLEG